MKVLIGFDGTPAGEVVFSDLSRTGLPKEGEATVLTVADVWPPSEEAPDPRLARAIPYVLKARTRAKRRMAEALESARRGVTLARATLKGWRVTAEAAADSPPWALFKKARAANVDLVMVGAGGRVTRSHGSLGSVAHKVLLECPSSVRTARPPLRDSGSLRILWAVDGSRDADRAVSEVLSRSWSAQTLVRVLAVADEKLRDAAHAVPSLGRWVKRTDTDPRAWLGRLVESIEKKLLERGVMASGRVREGDPKRVIVEKAIRWNADMIFVGARGLTRWQRAFMGSVSTAVAGRARCTVEVVRSVGG